jgi:putative redox protein
MTATILYEGNLRCMAQHLQSGTSLETDAPTDNKGKGERFSPTDLVCTALATCIITTMAIKTDTMGIELKGTSINVKKHMITDPIRMIGAIDVEINFPNSLILEEKDQSILRRVGDNCPVTKSLHPDVKLNIVYNFSNG